MKAAHPREIIKRTTNSEQTFVGQLVVLRLSSGGVYRGQWLNCDAATFQVTLKDEGSGSVLWLDASHLESITFPSASDEMLSILSDQSFDPFSRAEKVGDLALSRQVAACTEELSSVFGQSIKISFEGIDKIEENLARVVLIDVAKQLTTVFKSLCSDDFSKNEVKKSIDAIRLVPTDKGSATLENKTLTLAFAWKNPKERWTERTLADALNSAF